jgi:hypothetical protein
MGLSKGRPSEKLAKSRTESLSFCVNKQNLYQLVCCYTDKFSRVILYILYYVMLIVIQISIFSLIS